MIEKSMYDSWASHIRIFIKGKKNGRMKLDSINNGLLVYPTIEENGQTQPKKYFELTEAQQGKGTWQNNTLSQRGQEAGQILDEEQLAFIADPGIEEVQVAQQIIP
ncbi:hypothetical protein Tco_0405805 [Tanacetum coccineum]